MFSWCVVICGTSYMCGARPTCFMKFCAMRRRLCLVRVHPGLTNVFFSCLCLVALNSGRAVEAAQWGWGRQPACVISSHLAAQNNVFKDAVAAAALVCVALAHVLDVQRQHLVAARVAALAALLSVFQPPRRQEPRSIKPVATTTSSLFRETGTHLKCWWYSSPWKIQVTTFLYPPRFLFFHLFLFSVSIYACDFKNNCSFDYPTCQDLVLIIQYV